MSSSPSAVKMVKVTADARFPTATVSILDGHYGMVAEGAGRIEATVPPGLYIVQFKAGQTFEKQMVAISDDITVWAQKLVPPPPSAPQLLPNLPALAGPQCRLCVSAEGDGAEQFLSRIAILDASRQTVAALATSGTQGVTSRERNLVLQPGEYLLHVQTEEERSIEQTLFIPDSWQMQIFFRVPYTPLREPDFSQTVASAAILLLPADFSFVSPPRNREWIEVALQNLASNRGLAPVSQLEDAIDRAKDVQYVGHDPDTVRTMLRHKFIDPMLGIIGAHLLLLQSEPNRALLEEVIKNLDILVPNHPDVTALKLRVGSIDPAGVSFALPPMLRSSWRIIVEKTAVAPGMLPSDSYAALAAGRTVGAGGWLVWLTPPPGEKLVEPAANTADLLSAVCTKVAALVAGKTDTKLRELIASSGLSGVELAIVTYLASITRWEESAKKLVDSLYRRGFVGGIYNFIQKIRPNVKLIPKVQIVEAAKKFITIRSSKEAVIHSLEIPESTLKSALAELSTKLSLDTFRQTGLPVAAVERAIQPLINAPVPEEPATDEKQKRTRTEGNYDFSLRRIFDEDEDEDEDEKDPDYLITSLYSKSAVNEIREILELPMEKVLPRHVGAYG